MATTVAAGPRLDAVLTALSAGVASSTQLEQALGMSQSWMSLALRELMDRGQVVRIGARRGARYALRREVAGIGSAWPLHRVDRAGELHELGTLYTLSANQYYLERNVEAADARLAIGPMSDGVPYLLQDQRPGGFLGRAVTLRYPQMQAPQRVQDWTDDHYLRYLTQFGSDTVGDLILGRAALDAYVEQQRHVLIIDVERRENEFPRLVAEVMKGGLPGSSAQGEHPKFAVALREGRQIRSVLVKFSPPVSDMAGRRWSDLLTAEHVALETLREAGIASGNSQLFHIQDRTYLEVDRFDRVGSEGRIGITSLLAIDSALYGRLDNWIASAERLHRERRIDTRTLERIRLLSCFGELIANTDRHFGNLAFYDEYQGRFQLAPVYDMLPMLFAPTHEELPERVYEATAPTADTLGVWAQARALAEQYWHALTDDTRISTDFRRICGSCLQTLEALPRTGVFAPRVKGSRP